MTGRQVNELPTDHGQVTPEVAEVTSDPKVQPAKPAEETPKNAIPEAEVLTTEHTAETGGRTPVPTNVKSEGGDVKCSGDGGSGGGGGGGGGGEGGIVTVIPMTTTETVSDEALKEPKTPTESDMRADNLIVSEVTSKHRLRPGYLPPPKLDKQPLPSIPHSPAPPPIEPERPQDNAPIIRSSAASVSLMAGSYAARPFSPTKNLGWQHRRFSKWLPNPSENEGPQSVTNPFKRMMSKEEAKRVQQPPQSTAVSSTRSQTDDPKPEETPPGLKHLDTPQSSQHRPQLHRQTSHVESRRLSFIPPPTFATTSRQMSTVASWYTPPPFSPPPPLQPLQPPPPTQSGGHPLEATSVGHPAAAAAAPVQRRAILPYGGAKSDGLINKHAFVTCNIIAAADRKKRESVSRSTTAEIPQPPEQLRVASPDPEKVIGPFD